MVLKTLAAEPQNLAQLAAAPESRCRADRHSGWHSKLTELLRKNPPGGVHGVIVKGTRKKKGFCDIPPGAHYNRRKRKKGALLRRVHV